MVYVSGLIMHRLRQGTTVETVRLLSNRKYKPDAYVDLSLDMEDYRRIKAESKE